MKASQFIFASFVASTAWAGSENPLAFFAKVKEGFLPLIDTNLFPKYGVTPFEIGDSSNSPIKVSISDNQAFTSRGKVGSYSSMLVQGDRADDLAFNKVKGEANIYYFYSCSRPEMPPKVLFVNSVHETCTEIEIHLLEYNPKTGYPEGRYEGYEGGDKEEKEGHKEEKEGGDKEENEGHKEEKEGGDKEQKKEGHKEGHKEGNDTGHEAGHEEGHEWDIKKEYD